MRWVMALVLTAAGAAAADTFTHKASGRRVDGVLVARLGETLVVKTDTGATLRLPAAEWTAALTTRPATSRPVRGLLVLPKALAIRDVPFGAAGLEKALVGVRVSGEVEVSDVAPSPDNPKRQVISAAARVSSLGGAWTPAPSGPGRAFGGVRVSRRELPSYLPGMGQEAFTTTRGKNGVWWRLDCRYIVSEEEALFWRRGDRLKIAGTASVVKVEVEAGRRKHRAGHVILLLVDVKSF